MDREAQLVLDACRRIERRDRFGPARVGRRWAAGAGSLGRRAGRAIAGGAAAASPGAFARGQRDALTPQRVARLREYWRAQLAGVPPVLDL
ncbi:hypothetical protein, partial [Burkholderia pseudomallei]|uniref:hypothetical protein n=1 Tax=Burkholderia pseudomallei TaxID=28450 RepID=UPI001F18F82C